MPLLSYVVLLITVLISNLGFAAEKDSSISLYCFGSKSFKHYESKEEFSAILNVNLKNKILYLEYITEVTNLNVDDKPSIKSFQKRREEYDVVDLFDGHLVVKKTGIVNDTDKVLKYDRGLFKKLYEVDIKEDDNALGFFNRFSGDLHIETKYFDKKDESFEFGWAIDLRCEKKEKLF